MARVVAVHGMNQQLFGPEVLKSQWLPGMRDGIALAGGPLLADADLAVAFYGDLFRPPGAKGLGEPYFVAADVENGFEQDLLEALWREAAVVDSRVAGPDDATKVRTPQVVQRALNALSFSRFFAGVAERVLIGFIKQVHAYLTDDEIRCRVQERVLAEIGQDTRVVVGHSLGSVVAYEALCARPGAGVTFVTLGSPLGIRNLIFDRLRPAPVDGRGVFPAGVEAWWNITDTGDVVALVKKLSPLFGDGGRVRDAVVHNGSKAHDVVPYLTAVETGRAISQGLG